MLVSLLLALSMPLAHPNGPTIDLLNELAHKRNVAALDEFLAGTPRRVSPFRVLATNGPFEGGRFGWKALGMHTPAGRDLVVFSTPLTMQDTGELVFERVGDKLVYIPEDDDEHVRIISHKFKVKIEPALKNIEAEDRVRFEAFPGAGKEFLVRFGPDCTVFHVENYDGNPLDFTQAGGVVAVKRPDSIVFGLTFQYAATIDRPNYAGSISNKEASLADDYWYPTIARQAATYDIELRAPQSWTCLAQGDLVADKVEPNWSFVTYRMDVPVVYYTISAGPYSLAAQNIAGRQYFAYAVGMKASAFAHHAEFFAPVIDFYESKFGKYPFKKWGSVVSRVYGAGALEAYSFATYGEDPRISGVHEAAHTWFGGIVPNSYLHSLWNESFAEFCRGLYDREMPLGNSEERRAAFVITPHPNPAFNEATCADSGVEIGSAASSLGYEKGAFVMQMLETEIGTDKMIASMKNFVDQHPKDRTAEWSDFEAAVARTTGADHKTFFDQWLRRVGWARPRIKDVAVKGSSIEGGISFEGPRYSIPCEAMVEYADGKREFVTLDTSKESFSIPVHGKPVLLSVDPWRRVLRDIDSNETPATLEQFTGRIYRDAAYAEYRSDLGSDRPADELGSDLGGSILIGNPETFPAMRPLCDQVGFKVDHNKLTYKGTTIDLNQGTAGALVDLPGGKRCMIALGRSDQPPISGRARLCVADNQGRFLRGETSPKTSGKLTFRL